MSDLPKLVRDEIPAIIMLEGKRPLWHHAERDELRELLKNKLIEEACEFAEAGTPEELADVLEVIDAIRREWGLEFSLIVARAKLDKREKRGGFDGRIVLDDILDDEQRAKA